MDIEYPTVDLKVPMGICLLNCRRFYQIHTLFLNVEIKIDN